MIFIFALLVVIVFVAGVAFIFQGYRNIPGPDQIVHKDDFDKIRNELDSSKEQEENLKLQLDSLTVALEKTRGEVSDAPQSGADVDVLKAQEKEYEQKIQELEKNLDFLRTKADSLALNSIDVITSLQEKVETQEVSQADPSLIESLNKEKEALQEEINKHAARVQDLESELANAQNQSNESLDKTIESVDTLTGQNKELTDGLHQITSKIVELETELLNAKPQTSKNVEEIKKMNETLLEREKLLQNKLTKSRTQITGLEAICKEFKTQIEQMQSK